MDFLTQFVDADKLGGWVRAGVGAAIVAAVAKWPALSTVLDPTVQTALGVVLSGIVVGAWSHYAKSLKVAK